MPPSIYISAFLPEVPSWLQNAVTLISCCTFPLFILIPLLARLAAKDQAKKNAPKQDSTKAGAVGETGIFARANVRRDITLEDIREYDYKLLSANYYKEGDRAKRALNKQRGLRDRRGEYALPIIDSPDDLVRFLGLKSFSELVLLASPNNEEYAFSALSNTLKFANYYFKKIPKKNGKHRLLLIPKSRLKSAQRVLLRKIVDQLPVHPAATGFRKGKSVRDHAEPHTGKQMVLAYDLHEYFPTIRRWRVNWYFQWVGYPRSVANILAQLTTTSGAGCEGMEWLRALPQGAPTSPGLANAITYRMDVRLAGLAKRFGASYTRYADDLAFSGDEKFKRGLRRFIPMVEKIIRSEGFYVNPDKRRFMRRGMRQHVVGLNLNDRPSLGRKEYDTLKAILHNANKEGSLESQNREGRENFADYLHGRIAWYAHFHPERGHKLLKQFNSLTGRQTKSGELPEAPPPD